MVSVGVAAVIPTHPARILDGMLSRALRSVARQTIAVDRWCVAVDNDRRGSAVTRNEALLMAHGTDWAAFLDSDDEWLPQHIATLLLYAAPDVDVVYTGCDVVGPGGESVPRRAEWGRFGESFDPDLLREMSYIPVTSLVRTDLALDVGGFGYVNDSPYDDCCFYLRLLDAGARFLHVPQVTWTWHHHGRNTSGRPNQGDAL